MHADVVIVGGGPVGLFLAGLLVDRGVDVAVLERRRRPSGQSRAIGLHPPALDALAVLGLDGPARQQGLEVHRGLAFGDGRLIGGITFEDVHPRFPFVLTLPQSQTERLLATHLERVAPGVLRRGMEVVELDHPVPDDGRPLRLWVRPAGSPVGEVQEWTASVVVGADGAHSTVRRLAGIGADRREWGDSYLMGDFTESPVDLSSEHPAGPTAVIHLHRDGVVESFPLPGGQRRWVVHTGRQPRPESARELVALLGERWPPTGIRPHTRAGAGVPALPDPATATMVSSFTVYRQLARRMALGRTVLVGDAAHAISPFGGQGMTLGWLDALALAPRVADTLDGARTDPPGGAQGGPLGGARDGKGAGPSSGGGLRRPVLRDLERRRRRAALAAARQAEANMLLGRPLPVPALAVRDLAARAVLATPLRHGLARRYTMGQRNALR